MRGRVSWVWGDVVTCADEQREFQKSETGHFHGKLCWNDALATCDLRFVSSFAYRMYAAVLVTKLELSISIQWLAASWNVLINRATFKKSKDHVFTKKWTSIFPRLRLLISIANLADTPLVPRVTCIFQQQRLCLYLGKWTLTFFLST